MGVEVISAVGHYDGFAEVVGVKKPGGKGCWCMSYRDSRVSNEDRPAYMKDECEDEPGPGVLAYVDGEAAGWCSIAPRTSYRRLMNSRTIPLLDEDAWSAVCFVIRPPFRGQGLMHELLAGAVDHARRHEASAVEGYPVEVGAGGKVDVVSGYVGTTRQFGRAGFERVQKTTGRSGGKTRWLMRKEL